MSARGERKVAKDDQLDERRTRRSERRAGNTRLTRQHRLVETNPILTLGEPGTEALLGVLLSEDELEVSGRERLLPGVGDHGKEQGEDEDVGLEVESLGVLLHG
jgi:hypothetical protein